MNSDELKAHRRAICEALIEGKQCQVNVEGDWIDDHATNVLTELFAATKFHDVRIKPEPRKVWIGWHFSGYPIMTTTDPSLGYGIGDQSWQAVHWQLVTEEVK